MSVHPENLFQPGDFVIHLGACVATGDRSFSSDPALVMEDTGEFLTLKKHLIGGMYSIFIVSRVEYPNFRKCTDAMMNHSVVALLKNPEMPMYGGPKP